jgi:hypothetical protein
MPRIAEFASAIIGFQSREMKYGVCVTSARANSDRQNSPGGIQAPLLDKHAFAHTAAHHHSNGIMARGDRRSCAVMYRPLRKLQ